MTDSELEADIASAEEALRAIFVPRIKWTQALIDDWFEQQSIYAARLPGFDVQAGYNRSRGQLRRNQTVKKVGKPKRTQRIEYSQPKE